uniref:Fibronectin type-III domain-containing protein n=1 Tax=Pavo cristatus TaxID=9049 RepID=A0A8C9F778_PAVCR
RLVLLLLRTALSLDILIILIFLVLSFFIGQTNLKSPQDIQVYAVNANFTLRWNYTGDGTNVTFSAQYQW